MCCITYVYDTARKIALNKGMTIKKEVLLKDN